MAGVQLKKTKRVDTTDEAIDFRRSPITLTSLRAIAADARLAVNPDQIRPASLFNTIAGAPPASSASQSRSAVPAGRRLRRRWIGKTTLLAQWHQQMVAQGERIAWLSLDEDDDDVWQFIPYLLQALRPLYADWDADFWRDMEEQKLSSSEQLLAGLINQLHYCPHDVYLIIDDFHVINDRGVYEALGYLIKHAPAALHLIIGSRFHPNLALSQLQARDQLVEIYDRDLQFTLEETKHYFSRTVALPLSNHHAQRLQSVTEGWIAGMKIASLSAELQHDPASVAQYAWRNTVHCPLSERGGTGSAAGRGSRFPGKNVLPQSVKCRIMQRSDRTR